MIFLYIYILGACISFLVETTYMRYVEFENPDEYDKETWQAIIGIAVTWFVSIPLYVSLEYPKKIIPWLIKQRTWFWNKKVF